MSAYNYVFLLVSLPVTPPIILVLALVLRLRIVHASHNGLPVYAI